MATVVATSSERSKVFYAGTAVLILGIVFVGFSPGYAGRLAGAAAPLPWFVHVHAAVFVGWMLLLIAQAGLVSAGRVDVHRKLGASAAVLVPLMLVLGYWTSIYGAQHNHPFETGRAVGVPFPDSYAFLVVPLGDLAVFAGLVAGALALRRRPEWHKRFMILAAAGGFLWPAISRMPHVVGNFPLMFAVMALPIVALLVHDFVTRGRPHAATLIGLLAILGSFPLRIAIGNSAWWHDFAVRLAS